MPPSVEELTGLYRNLLAGGQWLQGPASKEHDVGDFYRKNMISRGINAVWRQYSVYVYYVWLNDVGAQSGQKGTNCDLDRSGPQSAKYCGNEGVYYLYMWDGSSLDWPYGGPKLFQAPYVINPVVSLISVSPFHGPSSSVVLLILLVALLS